MSADAPTFYGQPMVLGTDWGCSSSPWLPAQTILTDIIIYPEEHRFELWVMNVEVGHFETAQQAADEAERRCDLVREELILLHLGVTK